MKYFKVIHLSFFKWSQDTVITEKQIEDAGFKSADYVKLGAIVQVEDPSDPPKLPESKPPADSKPPVPSTGK